MTALADQQPPREPRALEEIVVIAKRDEAVRQQVETALHDDRYVNDAHIAVTINNGVVTLSGLVMDEWDLRMAKRIVRRIPGVKRVVDDLEIVDRGD